MNRIRRREGLTSSHFCTMAAGETLHLPEHAKYDIAELYPHECRLYNEVMNRVPLPSFATINGSMSSSISGRGVVSVASTASASLAGSANVVN